MTEKTNVELLRTTDDGITVREYLLPAKRIAEYRMEGYRIMGYKSPELGWVLGEVYMSLFGYSIDGFELIFTQEEEQEDRQKREKAPLECKLFRLSNENERELTEFPPYRDVTCSPEAAELLRKYFAIGYRVAHITPSYRPFLYYSEQKEFASENIVCLEREISDGAPTDDGFYVNTEEVPIGSRSVDPRDEEEERMLELDLCDEFLDDDPQDGPADPNGDETE